MAEIVRQRVFPVLNTGRKEITLDLDSFPHEVHAHQPGTVYNARYRTRCFHPLVASVDGHYFLGARLREGNVCTADGVLDFVLGGEGTHEPGAIPRPGAQERLLGGRRVTVVIQAARAHL